MNSLLRGCKLLLPVNHMLYLVLSGNVCKGCVNASCAKLTSDDVEHSGVKYGWTDES